MMRGYIKGVAQAHKFAQYTRNLAKAGVLPAGGEAVLQNDPKYQAITLFKENCQNCHTVAGVGWQRGARFLRLQQPRLALSRDSQSARSAFLWWHQAQAHRSQTRRNWMLTLRGNCPTTNLKAIVEYCLSIGGEEAAKAAHVNAALAAKGAELWSSDKYDVRIAMRSPRRDRRWSEFVRSRFQSLVDEDDDQFGHRGSVRQGRQDAQVRQQVDP